MAVGLQATPVGATRATFCLNPRRGPICASATKRNAKNRMAEARCSTKGGLK
jgi:hypothetical protein